MDRVVYTAQPTNSLNLEKAALTTIVVAGVVYAMYEKITAPTPFSDYPDNVLYNDKTRYLDLCRYRKEVGDEPETWKLHETTGLPQYSASFSKNANVMLSKLHQVTDSDFPQKAIVIGIIYKIRCIFQSLDKRMALVHTLTFQSWKNYREDGFEAMFFTDLATWLSNNLITRDIKKIETAHLISQWITYCKKVQENVFLFRNNTPQHYDPKYRLASIINSLEKLESNVSKSCKASTFNDKIHQINILFTNVARSSFNLFFMLLDGVHREEILVDVLLDHHKGIESGLELDYKYTNLVKSYLCQSLISTLKAAGINDNDFDGEHTFDLESIEQHLVTNTTNIADLSKTGLWEFAQHHGYEIQMGSPPPIWSKNKLYIQIDDEKLQYSVISPINTRETGVISLSALGLQNQKSISLEQLNSKLTDILNITAETRHTYRPESNAKSYLDKIIQLNRSLLMLLSVRQSILLASTVGTGCGQSWVYGDGACIVHVENLLSTISHAFDDFNDKLTAFWRCFYTDDYALYHKKNDKIECYTRINKANEIVSHFEKYKKDLNTLKFDIESNAKNTENSHEYILECVKKLDNNMRIYSKITGLRLKPVPENIALKPTTIHIIASGVSVKEFGFVEKRDLPEKAFHTTKSVDLTLLPGKLHKISSDGNCFFHALSHELKRLALETLTHLELRQCGTRYLKAYPLLLEQFIPEHKTQTQYLLQMERDATDGGIWADGPIIEALALQLDVQLNIFKQNEHDDEIHAFALNKGGKRGIIGLFLHGGHYDALELSNAANTVTPDVVSEAAAVPEQITLISTPTTVCIQNKTYPLFDLVSKLLDASQDELQASSLHIMLEDQMITEPKKFRSDIQKHIYHNFLVPNITVVNSPAWISWLFGVAPSQHAKLSDLHQRVKAAMAAIYICKDVTGQVNTPTPLETSMMDILLYNKIKNAFEKHQFYNYKPEWADPQFKINKTAESVNLSLDPLKLSITRDTINQFSGDLAKQSADKDAKIAELTKENAAKDAELVTTKDALETKNAELVSIKVTVTSKEAELEVVRKALSDSEHETALNKESISRMRATFEAVCRKSSSHSNQNSNAFFTQQVPGVTSINSASDPHDSYQCYAST